MITPEQIEAVARAMSDTEWGEGYWNELTSPARREYKRQAASAISTMRPFIRDEVLEEAAKVCDEHAARYEEDMQICDDDGTLECVAAVLRGRAAAIRALKEKT